MGGLFAKQAVLDAVMNDDISVVYQNPQYQDPVRVEGVAVITQKVSCGYACIEMLSRWAGSPITEDELFEQNGGTIVTATEQGFCKELNLRLPQFTAAMQANLKNTQFIDEAYDSLVAGKPVPFQFAALYRSGDTAVWTLHYAIITGMDIPNDKITICNPYGYEETYTVKDFLKATRYESYENMEFYFKLAFAAGYFHKNTLYLFN